METIPSLYFTRPTSAHSRYSRNVPQIHTFSARSTASSAASLYETKRAPSPVRTTNTTPRSYSNGQNATQHGSEHGSRPRRSSSSKPTRRPSAGREGSSTNPIPHLREALDSLDSQMASLMSEKKKLESRLEQAVRLQSPVLRSCWNPFSSQECC